MLDGGRLDDSIVMEDVDEVNIVRKPTYAKQDNDKESPKLLIDTRQRCCKPLKIYDIYYLFLKFSPQVFTRIISDTIAHFQRTLYRSLLKLDCSYKTSPESNRDL